MRAAEVVHAYRELYGEAPTWLVRAPGRVNLIGDHTDYNEGFVLPMAIERSAWIALGPKSSNKLCVHSLDFADKLNLDLHNIERGPASWKEYVKAVAWALQQKKSSLPGWQGVLAGEVPVGSGLSSSASVELALARAFAAAAGGDWDPIETAKAMQRAENDWVGVASGIMDPLISAVAQEGKAALIDCRDLRIRHVPMPNDAAVVVMNTMKRRGLVDSAYNERRRQCEQAAAHFGKASLRDVTLPELEPAVSKLDLLSYRRARHVLTENQRTLNMAEALERGQLQRAGALMSESHASLRDDFEVSCAELDAIVEAATRQPGCFGARMTGAGFGGCAVALVASESLSDFEAKVRAGYQEATGIEAQILTTRPASGTSLVIL